MQSGNFFSGKSENFWINAIGFNLIWALCIFYGNSALPWVILLLVGHFLFHSQPLLELSAVTVTALLGYLLDCILTLAGFFRFDQVQGITPLWLVFLWIGFSCTLRQSLSYFREHFRFSVIFGAVAGSFAYMAAANFGAVELGFQFWHSAFLIGAIWALLFPSLVAICKPLENLLCS